MTEKSITPFGEWESPITSDVLVEDSVRLGGPKLDGENVYWTESRATEGGRVVVVRRAADGTQTDITPADFNVRTRVHEYGGGAYTVQDDVVYFTNFDDQRVYRQDSGQEPVAITPVSGMRYADFEVTPNNEAIVAVREEHFEDGREAVNTLVLLDAKSNGPGMVLTDGYDFYSTPRLNPEGNKLTWLSWNHPNMPWDGTKLWTADFSDLEGISNPDLVAGGIDESIFQPEWSPDGVLHFVSDQSGWWNLYRLYKGKTEPLHTMDAEFGQPQWVFGMTTYGFESRASILCLYDHLGETRLARLNTEAGDFDVLENDYTMMDDIQVGDGKALFTAGSAAREEELVQLSIADERYDVIQKSSESSMPKGMISTAQTIEFPTSNELTAHAYYYPPMNEHHSGPETEKPPLLVLIHGGPTSATGSTLRPSIQYWTSRGIAVVDVDYGGSTGYGRDYRRRLNGQWGVVDVEDCINAAKYLADQGLADSERMAIRGGSAGGFTTLAALASGDVFGAGASLFGVCDLEVLARDTHKFESRYLDSLIGPYPEEIDLYKSRSPLSNVDDFSCPIIFFQGTEDKVVPPNQSELMFDAVKAKGIMTALVMYDGEGHGFRQAKNIKHALDTELFFYGKVFGFTPAGDFDGVKIDNSLP